MTDIVDSEAPVSPELAVKRAQALVKAGSSEEAESVCHDVLGVVPEHPGALAVLGMARMSLGDVGGAAIYLSQAVGLSPREPLWRAWLATVCQRLNRYDEAKRHGVEAVRLDERNPDFLLTLALILNDVDERETAKNLLLGAIGAKSDHADAHMALGQMLLAEGDYEAGWIEYEWRNSTRMAKRDLPPLSSARWNGMRIPGGRLVILADQGFGDSLQFCRFIPIAAERTQEIIVVAPAPLNGLLARAPGVTAVTPNWKQVPAHAAHTRLSTLPFIFRVTPDKLPSAVSYLSAVPVRVAAWRERLQPTDSLRVGLVWSGRPQHSNNHRRSMALSALLPLADIPGVSFVSLQKPLPEQDRPLVSRFPDMTDLSEALSDFDDTAALIANLDLVVAIDTAVAHLAAALGKPVWLMVAKPSDWRWLLDREDSPWYPSVRLFRQRVPGDVTGVVGAVRAALASLASLRSTPARREAGDRAKARGARRG